MKKVTIHEIAEILNIDSSTVSRALNDSDRVNSKTKKKVLKKAEELGYRPNLLASNLRQNKSNTIGVVVPRISRSFFSSAIAGIEEMAHNADFNVVISQSLEKHKREQKIVNNLFSNRVDGILISVSMETETSSHLEILERAGVPFVFFDRHCSDMRNSNKVLIDDFAGAYEAVSHLIRNNCKRIVHFSGPQTLEIYKNRLAGYKKALESYGIPFDPKLVITSNLMQEDGKRMAGKLIKTESAIDAIFAANDLAAIGAMKYLKSIDKKIPEDIAIVGFSNEPVSEMIEPSLTTLDQLGFEIGKISCSLLLDKIQVKDNESENKTIILKPNLIIRDSSQKKGSL
ncbi:LacI family DNA-binding transcriptional regulator [Flagellimonas sp. 389]|uniref:LacI family DNA-binding transcriptional regulator n=1 Tax=Flagellimonas sp. 389 TaxID=2835862 RepID=UPI001BD34B37|nr:LacI family DNA-binding transcriptional regulator [Flagellimonas sp. 389]MBS9461818.1 LacI family DNA-binding transcriptional regulator [Flagellimonas sp. 389]